MNNKNYQYYNNRNAYGNVCIPRREEVLNYLIKSKFLSEFQTNEEKQQVLYNLGILQEIDRLLNLIDTKANTSQLSNYVTLQYFLRKIEEIKPQDEKSKGYFSSVEALLQECPRGEKGDWAIVNNEGTWYIYRYKVGTGWEQSETYDNSIDLSEYQKILIPGENIKTINGESILGEGNIEIVVNNQQEIPENCATKDDVAQETLRAQIAEKDLGDRLSTLEGGGSNIPENIATKEDVAEEASRAQTSERNINTRIDTLENKENSLKTRLDILEYGPHSYIIDGIKHIIIKKSQYNKLTEYEGNALYFVTKDWTFGEEFPIVFTDSDPSTTWKFGEQFPIVFTDTTSWIFGKQFPVNLI